MSDFERIIEKLGDANVRYLIVGGVAVVLHGYQRLTADLDLIVALDEPNLRAAMEALGDLGFRPRAPVRMIDFIDPAIRQNWVTEKGLTVFSLWSDQHPSTEVDLFAESPVDFNQAFSRSMTALIGRHQIHFASIDDLVTMKRAAGRPKDLLDIEELLRIKDSS